MLVHGEEENGRDAGRPTRCVRVGGARYRLKRAWSEHKSETHHEAARCIAKHQSSTGVDVTRLMSHSGVNTPQLRRMPTARSTARRRAAVFMQASRSVGLPDCQPHLGGLRLRFRILARPELHRGPGGERPAIGKPRETRRTTREPRLISFSPSVSIAPWSGYHCKDAHAGTHWRSVDRRYEMLIFTTQSSRKSA